MPQRHRAPHSHFPFFVACLFGWAALSFASSETSPTHPEDDAKPGDYASTSRGLLDGYDPVSYFDGHPRRGKSTLTLEYQEVTIRFTNAENRERFSESPERYLPQFGGYCAYGIRMGKRFNIDPQAFDIINGRLYLMLDDSTRLLWRQNLSENIAIAEQNWSKMAVATSADSD